MPESVKNMEKQEGPSAPAAPQAPAKPGSGFLLAARIWVLLGALCWGATIAYLLSGFSAMGPEVGALSRINAPLRGGGLAAGGAAAALLAWLGLIKFGKKLDWAKPGLGKWARGAALAGALAVVGFGGFSFYMVPPTSSVWWTDLWKNRVLGFLVTLKPILFPAAGIFLALGYGAFLFLNRERSVDFLVETEGEMRKVSWPARKEYVGSSVVVLVVVLVVSLFLTAVDHGLSWLMQVTKIGF
jgi:preprotein translocase SecE subunit